MEKVISVESLHKVFKAGKRSVSAVNGISFSVAQGEVFGVLGPNGAGKTTTLEILEGIKTPTAGRVEVLGLPVRENSLEIKRRIGVQLQSSEYLPHLTLSELMDLFASLYGVQVDAKEILHFVDLEEKSDALVKELSGGQKQRFTIATSLVHKPEIIFLDEPTTGLDPGARRKLWALIQKINSQGTTVVLTTHYMEEAEILCNRVAIMNQGRILTINEPKRLIDELSHTTQISFLVQHEVGQQVLQSLPGVEKVYGNFPKVILEISSLDVVSGIVRALREKHIHFAGFTVKTASLEDVYLDLTGEEYLQ